MRLRRQHGGATLVNGQFDACIRSRRQFMVRGELATMERHYKGEKNLNPKIISHGKQARNGWHSQSTANHVDAKELIHVDGGRNSAKV